jgi:hypothetical protein
LVEEERGKERRGINCAMPAYEPLIKSANDFHWNVLEGKELPKMILSTELLGSDESSEAIEFVTGEIPDISAK